VFCGQGKDNLRHYIEDCDYTKDWFIGLGSNSNEIVNRLCNDVLEKRKGDVLARLWREKECKMK